MVADKLEKFAKQMEKLVRENGGVAPKQVWKGYYRLWRNVFGYNHGAAKAAARQSILKRGWGRK